MISKLNKLTIFFYAITLVFGYSLSGLVFSQIMGSPVWGMVITNVLFTVIGLIYRRLHITRNDIKQFKFNIFGLFMVVVFCLVLYFSSQILAGVAYLTFGDSNSEVYAEIIRSEDAMLYLTLALVFAPCGEEMLFRGILYPMFRKRYSVLISAAIPAVLFVLLHQTLMHVFTASLFGLFLAFVYEKTNRVIYPIFLHMMYNLFSVTFNLTKLPDFMFTFGFSIPFYILSLLGIIYFLKPNLTFFGQPILSDPMNK